MSSTQLRIARHMLSCLGTLVLLLEDVEAGTAAQPPRKFSTIIAELAERIHAFLAAQTSRVTVGTVKKHVAGRDAWVAPALALLRSQGKADSVPGPRNAQLWCSTTKAVPSGTGQ